MAICYTALENKSLFFKIFKPLKDNWQIKAKYWQFLLQFAICLEVDHITIIGKGLRDESESISF